MLSAGHRALVLRSSQQLQLPASGLHRMGLDQARSGWSEFQYECGRDLGGPAPEKQLVVDGCRGGQIIFPWRCGFGRLPCSSARPHTHVHVGDLNWTR